MISLLVLFLTGCGLVLDAIPAASGADGGRDARVDGTSPTDAANDATGDTGVVSTDGSVDATMPMPMLGTVSIANAGPNDSQPAVIWDGSKFVVGLIADGYVDVFKMAPGVVADTEREHVTPTADFTRQDVLLSANGSRLAVGWTEAPASDGVLMLRVLPDDAAPRMIAAGILRETDRQDAALHASGGDFGALMRRLGSSATEQQLHYLDVASGSTGIVTSHAGDLGEFDMHESALGPLFVHGQPEELFHWNGGWLLEATVPLSPGSEGATTWLADGSVASVWLHDDGMGGRQFSFTRHRPESAWAEEGMPVLLPFQGSDQAMDAFSGGAVLAFAYPDPDTTGRTLGLVGLDPTGNVIAGPCRIPPMAPTANDPDIACGGGYCAIVWMEGSTYDGSDFMTRVTQVPDDPETVCPAS